MLFTSQQAAASAFASTPQSTDRSAGIRVWQHLVLFLLAYGLVITRKPDAILHAQFWAEDGRVWFADAYNLGLWRPFLRTETGYYQCLPRIVADLSLLVPLRMAPLVLNLIAIAVQVLPVNVLLSHRCAGWGRISFRALLAATYIAIPSSPEVCANITNEQWMLAFCALLLLVGSPASSRADRIFDVSLLALSGLTGPFCIFLLPISVLAALRRTDRWRWVPVGILAGCCLVQAIGLTIVSPAARTAWGVLGARFDLLVRIVGGNIFLGAVIGANNFAVSSGAHSFLILTIAAFGGLIIALVALISAPVPMRLMALYATLLVSAALMLPSSYAPPGTTQWEMIARAGGVRYWYLPTLSFIWLVLYGVFSRNRALKLISGLLLCSICFGVAIQWRRPTFEDMHFEEELRKLEAAPAGTSVSIPINPEGWQMRLIKHAGPGQR